MAGRKAILPRGQQRVQAPRVGEPKTDRALGVLASAMNRIEDKRSRTTMRRDIVDGSNKFPHNLGRPCIGYTLTFSSDSGTAVRHYIDRSNPRPDREIWIQAATTGTTFTDVTIEVF